MRFSDIFLETEQRWGGLEVRIVRSWVRWAILSFIVTTAIWIMVVASFRNVELVRANAPAAIEATGLRVVGYQSYNAHLVYGGYTCYLTQREGSAQIYSSCAYSWYGQIHLYRPDAIDPVSVNTATEEKDKK